MELEQQVTEQSVVYKPKKRDSAGRTEQQARAMDLAPASGSRPLYPGSKEQIAIGGNAPQPPVLSMVDEEYAARVGEAYAQNIRGRSITRLSSGRGTRRGRSCRMAKYSH